MNDPIANATLAAGVPANGGDFPANAGDETERTKDEPLPGIDMDQIEAIERAARAAEGVPADSAAAVAIGQDKAEAFLDAMLLQFVGIGLRGLMVSTAGMPPDVILRSYARVFARLVAEAMSGDLVPVMKARASVKEAFLTTLKQCPIKPAPPPAGHGQRQQFRQQG